MTEEKLNKTIVRFTIMTVILGLICWTIALIGFGKYESRFETSEFAYIVQALIRLKYYILDAVVGIVIVIQSAIIYNTELRRVSEINKLFNVKPPHYL